MDSFWNSENIYLDGDCYFNDLVKDIDEAKVYISVEMYIFNYDSLGKRIAETLTSAAIRGVKVQIIVDGVGSYAFYEKLHGIFLASGIEVKIYNPLPFIHPYYGDLRPWKKLQILITRIGRLNKRNHRKIVTIDNSIMYAGSFNFTAEHTSLHMTKAWKDLGMRVEGENVKLSVLNFKRMWRLRDYYRYKKQIQNLNSFDWRLSPLRLNHSLLKKRYYYKNFIKRIKESKNRIWLTTPYFIPERKLIRALGKASKRGIDVQILISFNTDVTIFRTLQFFYYPYLIKKGVKVFQYTETVLHAKNYIIDDWTTLGSSNLNHRSFLHDLEVDLVVQNNDNVKILEEDFMASIKSLKMMTIEDLKQRPVVDRFLSRLFFLFKYWF